MCVCVCLSVYKSRSGTVVVLKLLTLTHFFFECPPFPFCHKPPLTDAAAHTIYGQSEKKNGPVDLQSGLCCAHVCDTHVDKQCGGNYLFILEQLLKHADLGLL